MKNLLKKSILALGLISSCCFLSVSAMEEIDVNIKLNSKDKEYFSLRLSFDALENVDTNGKYRNDCMKIFDETENKFVNIVDAAKTYIKGFNVSYYDDIIDHKFKENNFFSARNLKFLIQSVLKRIMHGRYELWTKKYHDANIYDSYSGLWTVFLNALDILTIDKSGRKKIVLKNSEKLKEVEEIVKKVEKGEYRNLKICEKFIFDMFLFIRAYIAHINTNSDYYLNEYEDIVKNEDFYKRFGLDQAESKVYDY